MELLLRLTGLLAVCAAILLPFSGKADAAEYPKYELGHGWEYGSDYIELQDPENTITQRIIDSISVIENPEFHPVMSFEVSADGKIALALTNNTVLAFDETGELYLAFSVDTTGICCAFWADEHLVFGLSRSDICCVVSEDGTLLASYEMNSSWFDDVSKKSLSIDGSEFFLEKRQSGGFMCQDGYRYLKYTDEQGGERVLYTSNAAAPLPKGFLIAVICASALLAVIYIVSGKLGIIERFEIEKL